MIITGDGQVPPVTTFSEVMVHFISKLLVVLKALRFAMEPHQKMKINIGALPFREQRVAQHVVLPVTAKPLPSR